MHNKPSFLRCAPVWTPDDGHQVKHFPSLQNVYPCNTKRGNLDRNRESALKLVETPSAVPTLRERQNVYRSPGDRAGPHAERPCVLLCGHHHQHDFARRLPKSPFIAEQCDFQVNRRPQGLQHRRYGAGQGGSQSPPQHVFWEQLLAHRLDREVGWDTLKSRRRTWLHHGKVDCAHNSFL